MRFFLTMPSVNALTRDVGVVASVEIALAANRRHADAVAVAADAGDHARKQVARARMIDAAETKRIERRDRTRAHGEDIAQDATDAGGGSLVGLDKGRMVVAFHFESHGQPAADIDDAGIFTRPLQARTDLRSGDS